MKTVVPGWFVLLSAAAVSTASCDKASTDKRAAPEQPVGVVVNIEGGVRPLLPSEVASVDLPRPSSTESVQMVFAVNVDAAGRITVDGKAHTLETLRAAAKSAQAKNSELRAVIRGDSEARHGRIIQILDMLKQAGVKKIAFGVTPVAADPERTD